MSDLVKKTADALRDSGRRGAADLIEQQAARIAALEEGLRWYASREAWTVDEVEGPNGDYGGRARALLGGSNAYHDALKSLRTRAAKATGGWVASDTGGPDAE